MDTRDYIESGTLDLYVAGLLSVEEMRDVELKACQHPEIKTELESMQSSFEKYAMKYAMLPPAGLKEKIMREIGATGMAEKSKTIYRDISSSKGSLTKLFAAASVALLIVAAGAALYFSSQANKFKDQVAQLTQQQSADQTVLKDTKEQLAFLTDPNTVRIPMGGTPLSPQSLAMIYWNKSSKSVYLDVKSLPENPSDKQYQLWFIDPSNKPVSAGVFDAKTGEWLKMIDAPDAVAFAVTLEPRGGSVNPTMDQMYVIGKVSS